MKDSVDRIVKNGNSSVLYELAKKIGKAEDAAPVTPAPVDSPSVNVVHMSGDNRDKYENVLIVEEEEDMCEADEMTEMIVVKDGLCNDDGIDKWDLSECERLVELVVGNNCLQYLKEWKLSGFKCLERVEIGMGCMCEGEGCFEVRKCEKLRRLVIGKESCVKWSSFVMKDCENVEEVSIGDGCFVRCDNAVFESE